MNQNLKPCVIFDLDDTLFETSDINWSKPTDKCIKQLAAAKSIEPNVFLYQSIDFMINDPPEWAKQDATWPQEIFFCTARPEFYREATLMSLARITRESVSFLNRRLIMRPYDNEDDLTHASINTVEESKAWTLAEVVNRGYKPVLAFDNCGGAVSVYVKGGVEVVHHTIACEEDREKALSRYAT